MESQERSEAAAPHPAQSPAVQFIDSELMYLRYVSLSYIFLYA